MRRLNALPIALVILMCATGCFHRTRTDPDPPRPERNTIADVVIGELLTITAGVERRLSAASFIVRDVDSGLGTASATSVVIGIVAAPLVGLLVGAFGWLAGPTKHRARLWFTEVAGVLSACLGTVFARFAASTRTDSRRPSWSSRVRSPRSRSR